MWIQSVVEQMDALVSLPADWDSYGARPPDPRLMLSAMLILSRAMGDDTPAPSVVPTSRGGVQLEWHQRGWDIEVEVSTPHRYALSVYDRYLRTDTEWEGDIAEGGGPLRQALQDLTERAQAAAGA